MMTQDQGSMIRFHPVTHHFVLARRTFTLQPTSEQGLFLISLLQLMAASVLSKIRDLELTPCPFATEKGTN